ncbi:Hsp20/alpha crystallin family protein [Mailhella massiliensis]|uniref:Hsp20/alpha crystallin family protein n=1 Tax=Mailhella massiliensis TaxID=1903261 RepID=A0A921AZ02_9BACT|nr:Hsp20/alpha crystallin family protein [Mailhella massiliensis]HJD98368.1 Hsp20/alpha crystallin family protein [Mailhella massiliensis]
MKDFFLANGSVFRHIFYTTAMVYDRREQEPFPPVNVYLCADRVLVQALVPGLELGDIRISVEENDLLLEGTIGRGSGRYVREERYSGHFRRRIPLGCAVHSQARLDMGKGILHIELRKKG